MEKHKMSLDSNIRETLIIELELHKTEYSKLKDEIARWNEAEQQFLNLSIIAAGAGLGFIQIVGGPQTQIVLLLAPLVFHVFFREMLDCTRHVTDISRYLIESLVPRVNTIVDMLDEKDRESKIWWYEYYSAADPINLFYFIVQPMRYWIPVSAIVALLLVYWANVKINSYPVPPLHVILIILNVIYLFAAIIKGARSFKDYKIYSEETRTQVEKSRRKEIHTNQAVGKQSDKDDARSPRVYTID